MNETRMRGDRRPGAVGPDGEKQREPGNWKSSYIRLIRLGNWLIIPIYVFVVLIPLFYEWQTKIPNVRELHEVSGVLTYRFISGRAGTMVGIANSDGVRYFTCRTGSFGSVHDCQGLQLDRVRLLAGKQATIWWFEQPIYLAITQPRLVSMTIDSVEAIRYEDTVRHTEFGISNAPWFALLGLAVCVAAALYFRSITRKLSRG